MSLSTNLLTPMHLQKGQTAKKEKSDCALPHGTLQFNSSKAPAPDRGCVCFGA